MVHHNYLVPLLAICSYLAIAQGKEMGIGIYLKTNASEIDTSFENDLNITSTTAASPGANISERGMNLAINDKNNTTEIDAGFENDSNNTSTTAPPYRATISEKFMDILREVCRSIENEVNLPKWTWIVIAMLSASMFCCLCCCPKTLGNLLLCFSSCILNIALLPVHCCLNCLGFRKVGPRGGSLAAKFQSVCYGGNTPSGSCFSTLQCYKMTSESII